MSIEFPPTYDPHSTEKRLYDWWEAQNYFKPIIVPQRKPFVISMPPPNITGALHIGHAITAALEDIMIRCRRMQGNPTLWVPGSDHAGIATQNVVERALEKEGANRKELGREKFLERVWAWKEEYGGRITEQHRRLGASCDWDRERFTLDERLSRAVREAFVRLYNKGLIYRGTYLINWCPRCETAISDLEVVHQEEATYLWYVRYPLLDGDQEYITVATTRPETILGDTAVAVHPDDERYQNVVGRTAILPVLERHIPIITDEVVDPQFGTGAVKVTPAHDPTDYELGARHELAAIDVMTPEGAMNDQAGPYAGQDRYECRQNLVADLEREGLLVKIEDYTHSLGHCQRCDTIVEPRISTQWFVKIKPLAEPAIEVVRDGRIRIIPERFTKVYYNWMENIRDWCISRQLWWGHRIPVWYCDDCGGQTCATTDPETCAQCGSANIRQDEDVLDTWFSSGLWPFSTLGWPNDTPDLAYFYPTTVMETAYDILFFWVARMIMMGLEMTGDIPFDTIYLHGLVRDEMGRKYSKSLGNALDPLEVIEDYGTDALRFSLVTASTPGNDTKLSLQKVEAARNFANKIWNAARFVLANLGQAYVPGTWNLAALTLADRWIISRHNRLIQNVTQLMEAYQFGEAGRQVQDFLWGEFCDWYIEIAKIRLYSAHVRHQMTARRVLAHVLERTLRLLHPFMPFVTEEIWQHLPHESDVEGVEALIIAPWPEPGDIDEAAEQEMSLIMEIVRAVRNARAEYEVEPGRRIEALFAAGEKYDILAAQKDIIVTLARLDPNKLRLAHTLFDKLSQALTLVVKGVEIYLPLAGMVDLEAERERLTRGVKDIEQTIAHSEKLLADEEFTTKAPAEVVERERQKLEGNYERKRKLAGRLRDFQDAPRSR